MPAQEVCLLRKLLSRYSKPVYVRQRDPYGLVNAWGFPDVNGHKVVVAIADSRRVWCG